LRPDVVWFEEPLPEAALKTATNAARQCQLFLSVGTSTLVYPAAGLPEEALRSGAAVVEINPHRTPFTDSASFVLAGSAGGVLPKLVEALKASRNL
jgi:NAD-dependent deacetylase